MPYLIQELELNQPLPTLKTGENQTGFAFIIRQRDRAIGFLLQPMLPNTSLSETDLHTLLDQHLSFKILQEKIRPELKLSTPSQPFPSLTVAICTKDRPNYLQRCLTPLCALQQTSAFDILVVDNAPSNKQTYDLVQSIPSIRYTCEPKPGLDFARNRALQEVAGEILAFLDDDVVVDRGWLLGLKESWSENPDAGAFTGLVLPYELETEAQIIFEQRGGFQRGFEKLHYQGSTQPGNPLYPCGAGIFGAGCNMAFSREVLLSLGGFDEALDTGASLPGGGDLDIFYRVIRAGYSLVYEPQYLVYHQHRRELEKLQRQYWSWGAGFMAFVAKSYQEDRSQRVKFLALILWWFQYQLQELMGSLWGKTPFPSIMVGAELWGGIQGLLGAYQRSQHRIQLIRKQFS